MAWAGRGDRATERCEDLATDNILAARAGHRAVRVGKDGEAWIEGARCGTCGAVMVAGGMACRRCGSREPLELFRAAQTGTVYSWTVVHRSYPGIAVPFVSAIVDLDDGLTLKGTLHGVDPATVHAGMLVQLEMDDAGGAKASDGAAYVGFHFVARGIGE